jgi:hypothetical protein
VCVADEPKILSQMQTLNGSGPFSDSQQIKQYGSDMTTLGTDTADLASKLAAVPVPSSLADSVRSALDQLSTSAGTMQRVGTFIAMHGATTTSNNSDVVAATAAVPRALNSLAVAGASSCAPAS